MCWSDVHFHALLIISLIQVSSIGVSLRELGRNKKKFTFKSIIWFNASSVLASLRSDENFEFQGFRINQTLTYTNIRFEHSRAASEDRYFIFYWRNFSFAFKLDPRRSRRMRKTTTIDNREKVETSEIFFVDWKILIKDWCRPQNSCKTKFQMKIG